MNLSVVLVSPKYPGNVGAVARVMKNFGFDDLRLVDPRANPLSDDAIRMASGAEEILRGCRIYTTLTESIEDVTALLATTSRRERDIRQPILNLPEIAIQFNLNEGDHVALLFGPEDRGLSRDELTPATHLVTIPSNPSFPTLNLAQSAALCLYQISLKQLQPVSVSKFGATNREREDALAHIREALVALGFLDSSNPEHVMRDIRSILGRASLTSREVRILRGIARKLTRLSHYLPEHE